MTVATFSYMNWGLGVGNSVGLKKDSVVKNLLQESITCIALQAHFSLLLFTTLFGVSSHGRLAS